MALWENSGDAADVINAFADEHGDGTIMDAMRRHFRATADRHETALRNQFDAIAARVHETERVAEDETGMIPDVSIPVLMYHQYAADFRFKAAQEGITLEGNGYECWSCPEFIAWFKKKHPELVHREAARKATIIVPGSKYGGVTSREANRTHFTHGGLIAA